MPALRLMIPGPVDADDATLSVFAAPTRPHYGPEWMPLYRETCDLLQRLFETAGDVLLMPGPGTAALDAAIGSLVPPGACLCVATNGFFGERLCAQARAYGIHVLPVPFAPNSPVDPHVLRKAIAEQFAQPGQKHFPRALAVVHHETSTGVLNPVAALAAVAREFGLLTIVDAVSSIGGSKLAVDDWGIDACIGVGNKCLGVPPGVAMLSVSQRGWNAAEANPAQHGWYLDLRTWRRYRREWADWFPYPVTLPTNNVMALKHALSAMFAGGIDTHWAKIATAAARVRREMEGLGFRPFVPYHCAAPMMTAFVPPPQVDLSAMSAFLLKEHRILVAGGIQDLQGKIVRIGHMGKAANPEYIDALIHAIRSFVYDRS